MQVVTGAYQPILVLSAAVCLVGLIAWARDARADDPVVDHARRVARLRAHGDRARARDAWQSTGSVPARLLTPSPAARISDGLARALRRASRGAGLTVATAGAWLAAGVDSARPRLARAIVGIGGTVRDVVSRGWTECRSAVSRAAGPDASVIPFGALGGVPAPVPTSVEPPLEPERRRPG